MKFLLESNLSKLAKWLRFLGHDVKVLQGEINLKDLSLNQDRVFITTSRRWERTLKKLKMEYLVVPRHDWEVQLCLVIKKFSLEPSLKLNLCAYCGSKLKTIPKEEVKDKVPPRAYESAYDFTLCPHCGSVFWKGTHYGRMVKTLKRILSRCL